MCRIRFNDRVEVFDILALEGPDAVGIILLCESGKAAAQTDQSRDNVFHARKFSHQKYSILVKPAGAISRDRQKQFERERPGKLFSGFENRKAALLSRNRHPLDYTCSTCCRTGFFSRPVIWPSSGSQIFKRRQSRISLKESEVTAGFLQFGEMFHNLGKPVKGYSGVQVMDMMIADISRYPSPERAHDHIAGRLKRSRFVSPVGIGFKDHTGKLCCA